MRFKQYDKEAKFLQNLVKNANNLIKKHQILTKNKDNNGDLVTNLDLMIEEYFIKRIKKSYPNFNIVSEEYNPKEKPTENCFIIDPIDGTVNFANNLPCWGIQIAMRKDGKTIASVLSMPTINETYVAVLGQGAYLNGKRTYVISEVKGKPLYSFEVAYNNPEASSKIFKNLHTIAGSRKFGSTCSALCFVAKGALSGAIYFSNHIWDTEPGTFLITEAGGKVYSTKNYTLAANNDEFLELLKECLKKNFNKNEKS